MSNGGKVFLGGLPTEPDVRLLMERFGGLASDGEVTHADLESALNLKRRSSRYWVIVNAWRKRMLRERNADIASIPGVGFKRLAEPDRMRESIKDNSRGVRKIGKAIQRIGRVERDKLTDREKTVADHARRLMEATYSAAREAAKEIAIVFRPTKSLARER